MTPRQAAGSCKILNTRLGKGGNLVSERDYSHEQRLQEQILKVADPGVEQAERPGVFRQPAAQVDFQHKRHQARLAACCPLVAGPQGGNRESCRLNLQMTLGV